jgi:hypothetical protein
LKTHLFRSGIVVAHNLYVAVQPARRCPLAFVRDGLSQQRSWSGWMKQGSVIFTEPMLAPPGAFP